MVYDPQVVLMCEVLACEVRKTWQRHDPCILLGCVWRESVTRRPFRRLTPTREFCMPSLSPAALWPILLLSLSNVFMTFAWYGHLKYKTSALWIAIVASWGIAFFEYCLAVPANRIGAEVYSAAQLKTMQEVITLIVFAGFSVFFLKESLTINHAIGFALIAAGAAFVFRG